MRHPRSIWSFLLVAFVVSALPASAQALNDVSWVSATGDDANPCTRALPCRDFISAQPKTQINGEIKCLDGGNFALIIIKQSLTIDCHEVAAVVDGRGCFVIDLNTTPASDPAQTVKIRGVTCGPAGVGVGIVTATAVYLEDLVISEVGRGVVDDRKNGGLLVIRNSIIRNSRETGIVIETTGGPYEASLDHVSSLGGQRFGLTVASGNNVRINNSEFSNNGTGIQVDSGGQVGIEDSVISINDTGLQADGTMSFSSSDITFNNTAISGSTSSFGNNRIFGNTSAGTPPSPVSLQ